jgi:uncharacterized protein (DUF1499 family)
MGLFSYRNDTSCWNNLVYSLPRTLVVQRSQREQDKKTKDSLFIFIRDDLEQRLHYRRIITI